MTTRWMAIAALFCLACSSSLTPVNPPSFVRPERVAFVCVRPSASGRAAVPVALELCSPCAGSDERYALHALVTQTTRGELGAVDLSNGRVIDTQHTVPGDTFVPVGEAPTAVVVPARDPRLTYVANAGSSDLRVLDTAAVTGLRAGHQATLAIIPLGRIVAATGGAGTWEVAEPVDMVLSPDEQRLVIAAPRSSSLVVLEIADLARAVAGEIAPEDVPQTFVPLAGLSVDTDLLIATGSDRYTESCGVDAPLPSQALAPRRIQATSEAAQPVALAVDPERERLYVADAALPVIHVVDLATLTEVVVDGRPLLVTDRPTLDVAVSPPVPASPGDSVHEQYIYAIDVDRRDVLVMNDRGVMQSVNAPSPRRADRLDLGGSAALAIEVVEPGFRGCSRNTPSAGPRHLRGVYLAAAMLDGTIRIVDIYDLDASQRCEAAPGALTNNCSATRPCVAVHRHRPRVGTVITHPTPCVSALVTDGVRGNRTLWPIDPSGRTATGDRDVPRLAALGACSEGKIAGLEIVNRTTSGGEPLAPAFQCTKDISVVDARENAVCLSADLWARSTETWTASWEGQIPGTLGSGALRVADGGGWTLETDSFDVCAVGVVGGDGFQVQLLVEPADKALREQAASGAEADCTLFAATQSDGTSARLTFAVAAASFNTLTLGDVQDLPEGFTADDVMDAVRYCVAGQRVSFVVRSRDRYTVHGSGSGFLHRIARGVDGVCEADDTRDPALVGQAAPDTVFENTSVAFRIATRLDGLEPASGTSFTFAVPAQPASLRVVSNVSTRVEAVWTILSDLRYNPVDARLYAVDSAARGLAPIALSPLPDVIQTADVFR